MGPFNSLVLAAARPYWAAGVIAWGFAHGKLGIDPVFPYLMRHGLLPDRGRLLDLGCGQGVLMALLRAAKERFAGGKWPQNWPAPPLQLEMRGVELRAGRVRAARLALGNEAQVEQGDLRETELPPCSAIAILDVLLYMDAQGQRRALEKCARVLEPGGLLLLREADPDQGFTFQITYRAEQIACWMRGQFRQKLLYRRTEEWRALLGSLGFAVEMEPMSAGTPFANVLMIARRGG